MLMELITQRSLIIRMSVFMATKCLPSGDQTMRAIERRVVSVSVSPV